jgi:polyhydroxyalkanoate synthase
MSLSMADDRRDAPPTFQPSDPEALARNLAKLYEEYGKAVAAYIAPREAGDTPAAMPAETADVVKTLGQVAENWLADPKRAVEAQTALWRGYIDLWGSTISRLMGEDTRAVAAPEPGDRRFADPEWQRNLYFDFTKQLYLLTTRWAEHLVQDAEGLDEHTRHKAEFYVRQIGAAMSPSNYLMTNPELLRETMSSNGENLVRGMKLLAEDLKIGKGELKIRQSDPGTFEVGRNLATTPGKVIFRNDLIELIQYAPTTSEVLKRPTLIVPPWINKFYILDLTEEKSFVKWMVDQGQTVFCISWVNPDERQAKKSFEDYMREGVFAALEAIDLATGEPQVNAIGYCVGGTLLGVTLAYMAAMQDDRIASATLLTTQVDFTYAGDLKVFVDEEQLQALEQSMARTGYLEGRRMASAFNMLRANDLIWPYVVNNYIRGQAPRPFDLLYWNSDSTRMPAANHAFYLRRCYLENQLTKGEMTIGGKKLDLGKVRIPIYNLATREDHIAPAKSVFVGSRFFGGKVDYVLAGSGHIAGVVNPPAKGKYQFWTGGPPTGEFETWTKTAVETPGSWWPHWQAWLEEKAPARVKPRKPGRGKLKALCDAPGTYVKVRD